MRPHECGSVKPDVSWGSVEEIRRLALYLYFEHADLVKGADILVDGGCTAQ